MVAGLFIGVLGVKINSASTRERKRSEATKDVRGVLSPKKAMEKRRTSCIIVMVWQTHYRNTGGFSNYRGGYDCL